MDWPIILLGFLIGTIAAFKSVKRDQQRTGQAIRGPVQVPRVVYPPLPIHPRPPAPGLALPPQVAGQGVASKAWVETWRKSIVGLVRLAQGNLASARRSLETRDCDAAVERGMTSVENISRALIHCYGEKPELQPGQEETLQLLSRRLNGNERTAFEKAIEVMIQLYGSRPVNEHPSTCNIGFPFILTKARTKRIIDSASEIVTLFTQIIHEHFATEIPELLEACPKCHAIDISMWSLSQESACYACNICGHKWSQAETA
jgi:hypothetical protein